MTIPSVIAKKAIRRLVDGKTVWVNPGTEFTPSTQAELDVYVKFGAVYQNRRQAASAARAMEGVRQAEGAPEIDADKTRLEAERVTAQSAEIAAKQAAARAADEEAKVARDQAMLDAARNASQTPQPQGANTSTTQAASGVRSAADLV